MCLSYVWCNYVVVCGDNSSSDVWYCRKHERYVTSVFADRGLIFVVRQRWGYAEHDTAVGFLSIQKQRIHIHTTFTSDPTPPLQ